MRLGAVLLMLVLVLAAPGAAAQPPLQAGETAPDFSLPGRDGQTVSLAALRGKLVLLHFWASWCPVCQQSFPWYNALQQRHGSHGLQVLGVGVDLRRDEAEAFLRDHQADFLVGFDPADRVPRAYDVRAMPTLVLVGADGRVRRVDQNFLPADQAAVEAAIKAALGGG